MGVLCSEPHPDCEMLQHCKNWGREGVSYSTLQRVDWCKGSKMMPSGFPGLWQAIRLLAPKFSKPHLPGEHTSQTRLSQLELMTCSLVTACTRTWREEPCLALVQLHNRKSSRTRLLGCLWLLLPLGWISTCSVLWCCSGDTACALNNWLVSSWGYREQYAGQ